MKVGFFEESEGVKSSVRLNSFIALCAAIVYIMFALYTKQTDANVFAIFYGLLVGAFAPKVIQKFAEK